jgi:acetyl/propionyl-CoA carboxylase alpha subunit
VIRCLLVANRGEIALRVFASCRRAGIGTVAVFSDPDAGSPHVAEADAAVRLPGSSPAQTYLDGDALVAAALTAGADAVHPGYGFLAEDPAFARRVLAVGLTWVGLPEPNRTAEAGSLIAPMPGSVSRLVAVPGDRVAAGQIVLTLEAMKMEHQITAPAAGVLAELRVGQGSQVNAGDVLAIVATSEPEADR